MSPEPYPPELLDSLARAWEISEARQSLTGWRRWWAIFVRRRIGWCQGWGEFLWEPGTNLACYCGWNLAAHSPWDQCYEYDFPEDEQDDPWGAVASGHPSQEGPEQ